MALLGKVALITGAAQGLGKAFSEALLKKGAKVCLADVQQQAGETTASAFQQQYGQDRAMFISCDVTSTTEMNDAFTTLLKTYGHLDIMVNNAGIGDEINHVRTIGINVTGVITGTKLAVDAMNKEKGGRGGVIINVASTAGVTPKIYMLPTYTASKFAVTAFTECWSHNPYLKKMGVRFACLCPAFTDTDILSSSVSLYQEDFMKVMQMVGVNPVSKVVEGFMQLVEDEQCNGAVMTVTTKSGIEFHKKPLAHSKM